jgi:serine/threonine-protein kinase
MVSTAGAFRCAACGTESPTDSRFCRSCGQALQLLSGIETIAADPAAMVLAGPHVRRLISSDSVPLGGFTPGTILIGRYRVIGLLGRGGMGEVYRADDLKLGQAVALKFLPSALSDDPVRRERFFAEVRITRQVSHPNICRVYDIAELDEPSSTSPRYFLTMEYIDGEDMASLLQRIGYLADEKALDLARQLVAGLAAAHERGVLHRDLKPANIMVDGRGRVRITDFGLAVAASDDAQAADAAGTPAYMAPEQLAGKGATVRSDIYALGLVLYELYTGRRAFAAPTLAELREQKESAVPTAPSELRPGVNPVVERVIMRCLERDPRARPASLQQVSASLPGGDPLAAAIAAGETPSPEMVAAAGAREGLGLRSALALLVLSLAGIVAAAAMGSAARFLTFAELTSPPEVLADRAEEFFREAGYEGRGADRAYGFIVNQAAVEAARRDDAGRDALRAVGPALFWYRTSPGPLTRTFLTPGVGSLATGGVTATDPVAALPGERLAQFDPQGRLLAFQAIPEEAGASALASQEADWRALFEYARLDASRWREVPPTFVPSVYADRRAAWTGSLPGAPGIPVRLEAASYAGKPVMFRTIVESSVVPVEEQGAASRFFGALIGVMNLVFLGGAVFFAHRNIRSGRGDRRGANRIVLVFSALWAAAWLLSEDHSPSGEGYALVLFTAALVLGMGSLWIGYMALEPFVRRRWPNVLVSWTRLLRGEWRDPLVGRDVLIGSAAGLGIAVYAGLAQHPEWLGYPALGQTDLASSLKVLNGPGTFLGLLLELPTKATSFALFPLVFLFFLNVVFRRLWIAAAVVIAFFSVLGAVGSYGVPPSLLWLLTLPSSALSTWLLLKHGLLASVAYLFTAMMTTQLPMTLDASAWYASSGFTVIGVLVALVVYAFRTSLGGRRVFELGDV